MDDAKLPDGWKMVRLGDVLKLEYGISLPERDRQFGDVPVLGSAGVVGFHSKSAVQGPGVVVGRKGSIGSVTWIDDAFVPIDTTYYVTPQKGHADLRWLYYLLDREHLSVLNRATGVPGLNRDDVYALRRPIPPLPEQRAIADVLDSIDDAIERTEAVIAATETLRDSLLHELLTRGVPGWHTQWKDVPGIGTIPAGWEVVRLGEVAEILDSRRIPLNADDRVAIPGPFPYYGANGVVDYIDQWIFDEPEALILMAEDGGHFDEFRTRPIAYRVNGKCWVNNHAHVLNPKISYDRDFFFYSLVHKDVRPFINGSTRSKLTQTDLKLILLARPPIAEQQAIANVLDGLESTMDHGRKERTVLQSLKESNADELLSGKTRLEMTRPQAPR